MNVLKYDIKNVCLDDCTIIEYHTHESDDVHISYSSVRRYFVFLYRNDFPLKKRIATIYYRLFEIGLINHIFSNKTKSKTNFTEKSYYAEVQESSLTELRFAIIYFIGIGNSLAILIFLAELILK